MTFDSNMEFIPLFNKTFASMISVLKNDFLYL